MGEDGAGVIEEWYGAMSVRSGGFYGKAALGGLRLGCLRSAASEAD